MITVVDSSLFQTFMDVLEKGSMFARGPIDFAEICVRLGIDPTVMNAYLLEHEGCCGIDFVDSYK